MVISLFELKLLVRILDDSRPAFKEREIVSLRDVRTKFNLRRKDNVAKSLPDNHANFVVLVVKNNPL